MIWIAVGIAVGLAIGVPTTAAVITSLRSRSVQAALPAPLAVSDAARALDSIHAHRVAVTEQLATDLLDRVANCTRNGRFDTASCYRTELELAIDDLERLKKGEIRP